MGTIYQKFISGKLDLILLKVINLILNNNKSFYLRSRCVVRNCLNLQIEKLSYHNWLKLLLLCFAYLCCCVQEIDAM